MKITQVNHWLIQINCCKVRVACGGSDLMQVWSSRLVLQLTVRCAGFDSRGRNPEIHISPDSIKILIHWTVTPSLVGAFHAAFYFFPPPLGGHHLVGSCFLSIALDGSMVYGSTALGWSHRKGTPLFLHFRTWWGTQAFDYSWANLMHTVPHQTPSGRTQDVDGIRTNIYLWISTPGIELGAPDG